MGNLPAKVTGRYQSYDISTPSHVTPPMTIRRNVSETPNHNNNFYHMQQQQQQQQQASHHMYQKHIPEAVTIPNPNRVAAKTYMEENDDDDQDEYVDNRCGVVVRERHRDDDEIEETASVKLNKSIDAGNHSFGVEDEEHIEQTKPNKTSSFADSKDSDAEEPCNINVYLFIL